MIRPCSGRCLPIAGLQALNQIQIVGTAESYKLAPGPEMLSLIRMGGKEDAEALDFSQPPITAQLDAGARALSFDVVYDPQGGRFKNPAGASMADELLDQRLCHRHVAARLQGDPCARCGF